MAIALSTCKKDISPIDAYANYTTYNIPQDFKDYFYFAPGSYWIYQNQRTQAIDSVYIVDRSSRQVYDAVRKLRMESIFVHYYDTFYGVLFETHTSINAASIDKLKSNVRYNLEIAAKSSFPTGGGDYTAFYPFIKGNKLDQILNPYEIISISDTFNFKATVYQNVVVFYSKTNILFNDHVTKVHYLKHFEIVRKTDLTANDDWVMVRCNIIK